MLIQYPDRVEELTTVPNTDEGQLFSQALLNLGRGLPELQFMPEKPEPAVICGGGPSLADDVSLAKIRALKELGGVVFALNNSALLLKKNGIRADYQIVLDAREGNAEFVKEDLADCLLLASHCHPAVFETALARGAKVIVFTHGTDDLAQKLGKALGRTETPLMVGGSHTVGLVALCVAYTAGHNLQHLFGYDSCHRDGKGHAYAQPMNAKDELLDLVVDGHGTFTASLAMVSQARAFPGLAQHLSDLGCEIHVHGDGLLPAIAKMVEVGQNEKPLTAVYDLASSPPTWEFITFLAEAERYRTDHGFTHIDILFSPGPFDGYRADYFRMFSKEGCDAMMQRIVLPACNLLPSVRNVIRLKEKPGVSPGGDLFPPVWTPEYPARCYGPEHLQGGNRVLKATATATKWREKKFKNPYVTITIREAEHWVGRNSDLNAWLMAADWLEENGYEAVFIPDTYGREIAGFTNCIEAAWDVDLRLALYEGAELNLGVSNGPLALCYVSEVPYIIFKLLPQDGSPITEAFYRGRGIEPGGQWGPNGKNVWGSDSVENIIGELENKFNKTVSKRNGLLSHVHFSHPQEITT